MTAQGEAYAMMSDVAFERSRELSWDAWAGRIEHLVRASIHVPQPVERGLKVAVSA